MILRGIFHDPGSGLAEVLAGCSLLAVLASRTLISASLLSLSFPDSVDGSSGSLLEDDVLLVCFSMRPKTLLSLASLSSAYLVFLGMDRVSHRPIQHAGRVDFKLHHYVCREYTNRMGV